MIHRLTISVHPAVYAICRLEADAALPNWALGKQFRTVTRTPSELSIVCQESDIPADAHAERKRRLLQIEGILAFTLSGVLASIATPLAEAGVSIFAISTYDTDYILVADEDLDRAIAALEGAGHKVQRLS